MPFRLENLGDALVLSFQQALGSVIGFVPQLLVALILFIIGLFIAYSIGHLVEQIVKALRVDQALQKLEVERVIERAGWKLNSGAFLGGIVRWFLIVVFLLAAVDTLQLSAVSEFLKNVLLFLPNVFVAALILVIAMLVASAAERLARGAVEALGYRGAIAGVVVRWAIWIFAIVSALDQLNIKFAEDLPRTIITQILLGINIAAGLTIGLAFGLGGKDAAADFIAKIRGELKK